MMKGRTRRCPLGRAHLLHDAWRKSNRRAHLGPVLIEGDHAHEVEGLLLRDNEVHLVRRVKEAVRLRAVRLRREDDGKLAHAECLRDYVL